MSLQPQTDITIPEQTHTIACAAFPKGNLYMKMQDELGTLFTDEQFADLFPKCGQPAQAPWRLALVTVMQFVEGLSDRQAAESVRSRIDWKYALALELTDPGFDFSVLCEFRARLLDGQAELRLLETLLTLARSRGWLKAGGKQRTDSTHVLAAVRALNRIECVGETLRHALNTLAVVAPDWLSGYLRAEWVDRYAKRFASIRLPQQKAEREELALTIGADGFEVMALLQQADAPSALWALPEVQTLRQVWVQNYAFVEDKLTWRDTKDMPPAAQSINSPHDPEARYSIKRDTTWSGYKVHFTETCDEDSPHLIDHVQTTPATTQDGQVTAIVHADLKEANLLPERHLVDEAYLDAELLVESPRAYGIDLYGPVAREGSWQAVADQGFAQSQFAIDWEAEQVTCPRGKTSRSWKPQKDAAANDVIAVKFSVTDCQACAVQAQCTRSRSGRRELGIRPKEQYLALQAARARQKTRVFLKEYGLRAGIEGTLSQGIRTCGMRRSRYVGEVKTHLQHVAIATALNLLRIVSWLMGIPLAKTRQSPLVALSHRKSGQMTPVPA